MSDVPDLLARMQALERRVRILEDVESIQRLKAHYGELVDRRYGADGPKQPAVLAEIAREIAELFTEDAVWDGGPALGTCRGRSEIRERFAEPTLRASRHYFVKPQIRVDPDGLRARGRWDLLAPVTTRAGEFRWLAGVEDDEYAKVAGRWLHARLTLRVGRWLGAEKERDSCLST
jgi:hypothetical protein